MITDLPKNGLIEVVGSDGKTKKRVTVDEYMKNKKLKI